MACGSQAAQSSGLSCSAASSDCPACKLASSPASPSAATRHSGRPIGEGPGRHTSACSGWATAHTSPSSATAWGKAAFTAIARAVTGAASVSARCASTMRVAVQSSARQVVPAARVRVSWSGSCVVSRARLARSAEVGEPSSATPSATLAAVAAACSAHSMRATSASQGSSASCGLAAMKPGRSAPQRARSPRTGGWRCHRARASWPMLSGLRMAVTTG